MTALFMLVCSDAALICNARSMRVDFSRFEMKLLLGVQLKPNLETGVSSWIFSCEVKRAFGTRTERTMPRCSLTIDGRMDTSSRFALWRSFEVRMSVILRTAISK